MSSLPQTFQVALEPCILSFHHCVWVLPRMDGARPMAAVFCASNCASTGCCTK